MKRLMQSLFQRTPALIFAAVAVMPTAGSASASDLTAMAKKLAFPNEHKALRVSPSSSPALYQ